MPPVLPAGGTGYEEGEEEEEEGRAWVSCWDNLKMSRARGSVWGSVTKKRSCISPSIPVPRRSVPGSAPGKGSEGVRA